MSITKAALADKLTNELGLNNRESKEFVESYFDAIKEALASNQEVKLSGFGNFSIRDKSERPGRNPKTGEAAVIEARRVVTFKAGQKLKTRLDFIPPGTSS